jgi:hypothetical protein
MIHRIMGYIIYTLVAFILSTLMLHIIYQSESRNSPLEDCREMEYNKRIWQDRKKVCLEVVGEMRYQIINLTKEECR